MAKLLTRDEARRIAAKAAGAAAQALRTRAALSCRSTVRPKECYSALGTCAGKIMSIQRLVVACAAAFAALMSASYAGPCSQGIDRVQAQFDAKLEANAAVGPSARESTAATNAPSRPVTAAGVRSERLSASPRERLNCSAQDHPPLGASHRRSFVSDASILSQKSGVRRPAAGVSIPGRAGGFRIGAAQSDLED